MRKVKNKKKRPDTLETAAIAWFERHLLVDLSPACPSCVDGRRVCCGYLFVMKNKIVLLCLCYIVSEVKVTVFTMVSGSVVFLEVG